MTLAVAAVNQLIVAGAAPFDCVASGVFGAVEGALGALDCVWRRAGREAGLELPVVVGGVGTGTAAAGWVPGARIRSAAFRLTPDTVLPGAPTAGTWVDPTMILSASGLPVVSTGAAAVAGTSKLSPGLSWPIFNVVEPSLTWSHTASVAVSTTGPAAAGATGGGGAGAAFSAGAVTLGASATASSGCIERLLSQLSASTTSTNRTSAPITKPLGMVRAGSTVS